jgi:CIC family chloride channel protein
MALNDRGYKIGLGRQHIQMDDMPLEKIISNQALAFREETSIKDVNIKMTKNKVTEAVIINKQNEYIGKITIYDTINSKVDNKREIKKLLKNNHLVLNNNISLVKSIEEASNFVGEFIPVKNFETNQYVGSVNESDLFRAYLNLQNQVLFVEKDTNN